MPHRAWHNATTEYKPINNWRYKMVKSTKKVSKTKASTEVLHAEVALVKAAAAPLFQELEGNTSAMDIPGSGCVVCKEGSLVFVPNVRVVKLSSGYRLVAEK